MAEPTLDDRCRDCGAEGFRLTSGRCDGCQEHDPRCMTLVGPADLREICDCATLRWLDLTDDERAVASVAERPTIEELIERSSLGTPEAKAIRETVDPGLARRVVQAAHADMPVTCQGCGAVRSGLRWLNMPHACWRNADGTYEEGGTFQ